MFLRLVRDVYVTVTIVISLPGEEVLSFAPVFGTLVENVEDENHW